MLKLENVGKIYSTGNNLSVGIRKVNLEFKLGEFVAITGESGSGKSTLLNILSGIDSFEEGEMFLNGEATSGFSKEELEDYRNKYVGFIFQNYNIIDSYTVYENVEAALLFSYVDEAKRKEKVLELLERVGLKKKIHSKASKLSGGEKQRVVIARALAKSPLIIAADEPTGNLDSKTSKEIIDLLFELSKDVLVLIVTHDYNEVKEYATRVIRMFDGEVKEDRKLKDVDDVSNIDISEVEPKKIKLKDAFHLSRVDIFSSPKRLFFYLSIIFLMSLFVFSGIAIYRVYSTQNESTTYSPYINTSPSRMIIYKKDKSMISDDDINEIKNMNHVDYIVKEDTYLDTSIYIRIEDVRINNSNNDGSYKLTNYFGTLKPNYIDNINSKYRLYGSLPSSDNEVVITASEENFVYDYSFKNDGKENGFNALIGKNISISNEFYEDSIYKVVGVIDMDTIPLGEGDLIYFTYQEFKNRSKLSFYRYLSIITYNDNEEDNYYRNNYIALKPSDELQDNEYYSTYSVYKKNIKISTIYEDLYVFDNAEFKNITVEDSYPFFVSTNVYNAIMEKLDDCFQISIFTDNVGYMSLLRNRLKNDGYRVIIPSKDGTISIGGLDKVLNAIIATIIGIFLMVTFFIVYVILLHSMKSRNEDIEILRTIGAKEKEIANMFSLEFLFIGIMSYILVIAFYLVLRIVSYGDFLEFLKTIKVMDFIIVLVLVLLMNYLLARRFSKKLFKKTIKSSLDER